MSRNGIYNIAGALVRTAVGLATIRYVVKFAGLEAYGVWTLAASLVALVAVAESALNLTTIVFVARDRDEPRDVTASLTFLSALTIVMATVLSVGLYFDAELIAAQFSKLTALQCTELAAALRLGSAWVWTRLMQQLALGVQQGFQRYGPMNVLLTLQSSAANLGMIVLANRGGQTVEFMHWQVWVSAAGLLIHGAYAALLLGPARLKPAWNRARAREVGTQAWWTCLSTLGSQIFSQADRLVVGSILGASVAAIYAAITSVAGQINSLSAIGVQPLLPEVSRLLAAQDAVYARPRLRRALEANAIVALALAVIFFAFAARILALMLPGLPVDDFVLPFRLAMVIYALYSLNATGYMLCLGLKATRETAAIVLCSALLAIASIALGASKFGLNGAVAGNAGYQLAWLLTILGFSLAHVTSRMWLGWLARPMVAFGLGIPLCWLAPNDASRVLACGVSIIAMFGLSDFRVAVMNKLWRVRCILKPGLANFTLPDGSKFVYPADSIIGFCLFNGSFEGAELRFIRERLKSGGIFVDIGANGGIFTVVAARVVGPEGRVIAFEPDPRNVELLRRNVSLNQLTNVTIVSKAVSASAGTASLAISTDGAMNSLAKTAHAGQKIEKWESVETTTLDAALKELNVARVDVLKIDVEGAERLVLEGAHETLARCRDVTLFFEAVDVAAYSFHYTARILLSDLHRQGFVLRHFDGERLVTTQNLEDPRLGQDIYNFVAERPPIE